MHALERHEFSRVRAMARQDKLDCAAAAVVDGHSPGHVWVDDPAAPAAALVDTPEGAYLLGLPRDDFAQALADFIVDWLRPGGQGEDWWWFSLRCSEPEWAAAIREVLPASRTAEEPREFYLCERAPVGEPQKIPAGYELIHVDRRLLQREDLENVDRIRRAEISSFGSIDAFLEKGFAFCVRHEDELASWNVCDCVSGARAEIGIHTVEGHRQRGLASAVATAAVQWGLSHGFDSVGWHCHAFNTASAATAVRAGFRKVTDYTAFKICARPADADVLKATAALIEHRFQASTTWYDRAFEAVATCGPTASYLLANRQRRAQHALRAACACAFSGQAEAGTNFLDDAIDLAGIWQGGY